MTTKQAIIAGLICLDVLPDLATIPAGQFQELFQPGRLVRTGSVQCRPGGPVANVGLALHQLGIPVRLIGKIGADLFGDALQAHLRSKADHLAQDLVIDLSQPTGFTIVINPPGTDRAFLHNPGANDTFYASDLPREILASGDLFHFGYPSMMRSIYRGEGAELVSILMRARRAGLSTSLDFTLPDLTSPAGLLDWPTILANTLPLVDLFTPSIEELLFLLDREAYLRLSSDPDRPLIDAVETDLLERMAELVLGYGVKALLVKLGHRGLYLKTAPGERWQKCGRGLDALDSRWYDRQIWMPAFDVKVKGNTGAGDAANAGFLASILRGLPPETALQMAAAAGALSVESGDIMGGLSDWEGILTRVQHGWQVRPLALDALGWVQDQAHGVWEKPR